MRFDPEALIFDFDGVVVDSELLANTLLAEFLTSQGLATRYEDALDLYKGRRWTDTALKISEGLGRPVDDTFREAYRVHSRNRMRVEVEPVAGVSAFLAAQNRRRLAVASSSHTDWLTHNATKFALTDHFGDHLYSAINVERGKPHPDIFLLAASGLGSAPARCLVIEDSPAGIEGARAAGMTAVGFVGASHARASDRDKLAEAGAHVVVSSYAELTALLVA